MDNLKLFTVLSPRPASGVPELSVCTRTRQGHQYCATIADWNAIQVPKPFLTQEVCQQLVVDRIQDFGYVYDAASDTLRARLPVLGDTFELCVELKRVWEKVNLVTKVAELEARLEQLEPFEVIHEHKYPTWSSLDDFKRLPEFCTFDALRSAYKYLHPLPRTSTTQRPTDNINRMFMLESRGFHVIIGGNRANAFGTRDNNPLTPSAASMMQWLNLYSLGCTSHVTDHADQEIERALKNRPPREECPFPWEQFVKRVERVVPEPYLLSQHVGMYMCQYLAGWVLLHPQFLAFRRWKASITVQGSDVLLTVYRTRATAFCHGLIHRETDWRPVYFSPGHEGWTLCIDGEVVSAQQ